MSDPGPRVPAGECERLATEIRSGRYSVDPLDVADAILRHITMRDLIDAFDQSNDATVTSSSSD